MFKGDIESAALHLPKCWALLKISMKFQPTCTILQSEWKKSEPTAGDGFSSLRCLLLYTGKYCNLSEGTMREKMYCLQYIPNMVSDIRLRSCLDELAF